MNVIEVDDGGRRRWYLSPLGPDDVGRSGLPREAIVGELESSAIDPARFHPNPIFPKFLAWAIAKHVASAPGLVAEATRLQKGHVYIIDGRTPTPEGPVPPEDIIGYVEVAGGKPVRYAGSDRYQALTASGPMKLDGWLYARLIEELRALAR